MKSTWGSIDQEYFLCRKIQNDVKPMSLTPEFRNLRSLGGPSELGRRVEAKNNDLVRTAVTTTRLVRISRRREDAVAVCRARCKFFCSGSSQRVPRTTLGGNLPLS